MALVVRWAMTIIYKKSEEIIRSFISPLAFLEVEIDCITLDLVDTGGKIMFGLI